MREASDDLKALLASRSFVFADLYHLALRSGPSLYLTSADQDLGWQGQLWRRGLISGGRLRAVRGLEVDETEFSWVPGEQDQVNGIPALVAVRSGLFDRAKITRYRAFMAQWDAPVVGAIDLFQGEISDVSQMGSTVRLQVSSLLVLLNSEAPSQVYQSTCRHQFGSVACGVDPQAYQVSGVALDGSSQTRLLWDDGAGDGAFARAKVAFVDGQNAGLARLVRSSGPGVLTLSGGLPFQPAIGDRFTVTPGCNKALTADGAAHGCGRFNNRARFGGYPWIPAPETGT